MPRLLSFANARSHRYRFRLTPFDQDWVETATGERLFEVDRREWIEGYEIQCRAVDPGRGEAVGRLGRRFLDPGREFGRQLELLADRGEAFGQHLFLIADRLQADFAIVTCATSMPFPRKPPSQYIR